MLLEARSVHGGVIWTEVQKYGSELWRQFAYLTHGKNAMNGEAMKMNWGVFDNAASSICDATMSGSFGSMSVGAFALYAVSDARV